MKKALRIGYNRYYNDDVFAGHLEFIKRNADVIDEVALFTEFSHYGYWDLETSYKNAELIKKRMEQYRKIGIKRVGINILCTIGHIEEGWDVFPKASLQYQVSRDGVESKACLCPSNDAFLDYIGKRYSIYANTGTDFIWLDDDLRIGNHGVASDFCFCPNCLQRFGDEYGTYFTRTELAEKIASDDDVSIKWNLFQNDIMLKLFDVIKQAIKGTDSSVEIGYMSYDDNANTEWISASGAVMGRPGGGFYDDESPIMVFDKSFRTQQQIKMFPKAVRDIQYEYEAFNYQTFEKSNHISELETSLSLMSGCSGVLYNNDVFNDRQGTVDMLRKSKDKWEILKRINDGCKNAGVYCYNSQIARLLNEISIPVTPYEENASAVVMLGDTWKDFSKEEIKALLGKNVLTDGRGLEVLHNMGFGSFCGGKVKRSYTSGMAERFGEHELNGEYKKYYRDVYMNYHYEADAYELEPSAGDEIISCLETITHKPFGCSMFKHEGQYGNRFAADGYLMLRSCKTAAKREQLCNVLDWLSNETLPIRIKKYAKIIPTVTTDENGGMNIMLTNASFDKSGAFECVVRSSRTFRMISQLGELVPVEQIIDGENSIISLNNIDAWNYILLTNKGIS